MTIRDGALAVLAADPEIRQAFARTSLGDRSVLGTALDRDNSVMMTTKGSPNDALWACFIRHGWMEEAPVDAELQAVMPQAVRCSLTEQGRRAIPVILPILFAETGE